MDILILVLVALILIGLVFVLCPLFGLRIRDPRKLPLSSSMGIVERKYHDINGAAHNVYPAIVIQDDDGTRRKLRLKSWDVFDDLFVGDHVQVDHRDWLAETVTPLERGDRYWNAQAVHHSPARFCRHYVDNVSWTRHPAYAEFITDDKQKLTLRTPVGWTLPQKNTRGTLSWHGNTLDAWSES